jgi:hypothetical protein
VVYNYKSRQTGTENVFRQGTQKYNMFTMKGGIQTTEAIKAPVKF